MKFNTECWKPQLAALVTATSLLTSCATVRSERIVGVCPPVVEYSRAEQALVASEIETLPESAILIGWLTDYILLREQTNICGT